MSNFSYLGSFVYSSHLIFATVISKLSATPNMNEQDALKFLNSMGLINIILNQRFVQLIISVNLFIKITYFRLSYTQSTEKWNCGPVKKKLWGQCNL